MVVVFLWLLCVLLGILLVISCQNEDKNNSDNIINTQIRFSKKFNKLVQNVTNDEHTLYLKIFDTIKYTHPENYTVWKSFSDEMYGIQIRQIYFHVMKQEKVSGFTTDGKPYGRSIANYECTGIDINDKNLKNNIQIIPPKEQMELFDLFVNYIIWKLEIYYDEQEKDKQKQISNEHQNKIKAALKTLKGV